MSKENTERVLQHIRLVPEPLAKPDQLTVEISVERREAAIFCDISTPPEKIKALVDEKADEIAAWLDVWGID